LIARRRVQNIRRPLGCAESTGLHRRRLLGGRLRTGGACGYCTGTAAGSSAAAPAAAAGAGTARTGRRARTNALPAPCPQIVAIGIPILRLAINDVVVGRVDGGVEPVAAADAEPVRVHDSAAAAHGARAAPAPVVLQADVNEVRPAHVGGDDVGEPRRHGVHVVPRLALIPTDV